MPDLDFGPDDYRDLNDQPKKPVTFSPTELMSFGIASWFATQKRDEEFEARQTNAILHGLAFFIAKKLSGGA